MGNTNLDINFDDFDFSECFDDEKENNTKKDEIKIIEQPQVITQEKSNKSEVTPDIENLNTAELVKNGVENLKKIKAELNDLFFERNEVIDNALISLVTGQSMLLLGEPGTGKSDLIKALCSRISYSKYFEWLLNRTSDPAEILGPFSIKAMEQDMFLRITTGKLPEANIVYLDEIFKCNEPTLNMLLPLINEKIFYNNGVPIPVPLISLFAASNETPDDESLNALYDRLLFRMWVDYINDSGNRIKMYDNYLSKRNGKISISFTQVSLSELQALQDFSKQVTITKSVLKSFLKLIGILNRNGIVISDRRQNECLKVLQGCAAINGRSIVLLDDFECLIHVLWQKREDIELIVQEINKIANPYRDKFNELKKQFDEISNDITDTKDPIEKTSKIFETRKALEKIITKLEALNKSLVDSNKQMPEVLELKDIIIEFNQETARESFKVNFAQGDESTSQSSSTSIDDDLEY